MPPGNPLDPKDSAFDLFMETVLPSKLPVSPTKAPPTLPQGPSIWVREWHFNRETKELILKTEPEEYKDPANLFYKLTHKLGWCECRLMAKNSHGNVVSVGWVFLRNLPSDGYCTETWVIKSKEKDFAERDVWKERKK